MQLFLVASLWPMRSKTGCVILARRHTFTFSLSRKSQVTVEVLGIANNTMNVDSFSSDSTIYLG